MTARLAAPHDRVEGRLAGDAPFGPAQQIESSVDDVLGPDGDGRTVGEHAGDLAARAAPEGARLAPLAGSGIVGEQDAAEREEGAQPGELRGREGATSTSPLQ